MVVRVANCCQAIKSERTCSSLIECPLFCLNPIKYNSVWRSHATLAFVCRKWVSPPDRAAPLALLLSLGFHYPIHLHYWLAKLHNPPKYCRAACQKRSEHKAVKRGLSLWVAFYLILVKKVKILGLVRRWSRLVQ